MINSKKKSILSPCISICKSDPVTGLCFGCARSEEEKKIWKTPTTLDDWKMSNLKVLRKRMSDTQLKTFERSYQEKIEFGKLVYSKKLEKKP